jgi:hypothetical protein
MKYRIQQQFFGGKHYVWCSPAFEGGNLGKYALGSMQPPSSDPASIYRTLRKAVEAKDGNDAKILSQKKTLMGRADAWHRNGEISKDTREEIVLMVKMADFQDWRPLVYVIPYDVVRPRVQVVPRKRRASHEPEYIIADLADGEFDIIEP